MLYFRHVNRLALVGMVILTWLAPSPAFSQTPLGTAFSYNGRLQQLGQPADGDSTFRSGCLATRRVIFRVIARYGGLILFKSVSDMPM